MALDGTYDGLKSSIATWLNRDDFASTVAPDLITLAEARINDRLRLAPMETRTTLQLTTVVPSLNVLVSEVTGDVLISEVSGSVLISENQSDVPLGGELLPSDFLEMRMVRHTSTGCELRLASPNAANNLYYGLAGWAALYEIIGNAIITLPSIDSIDVTYYAKIPALSEENTGNWLLTRYPNIYLYASLLESAPLLGDDNRAVLWKGALDQAIDDAQRSDAGSRWSNRTLQFSGPTP